MAQEKILGNQLNLTDVAAELAPYSPTNIVDDTSPQLGGDLDTNNFNVVTSHSIDSGSPATSQYSNSTVIRTGNVSTAGYTYSTAGNIEIKAGSGLAGELSYGGAITLFGGNSVQAESTSNANPGDIFMYGGRQAYTNGGEYGGSFRWIAGNGTNGNYGGYVRLEAGDASGGSSAGGNIWITSGSGNPGDGGDFRISSGSGDTAGLLLVYGGASTNASKPSAVRLSGSGQNGTGDAGDVEIRGGQVASGGGTAGSIILLPGYKTGQSDNTDAGSVEVHSGRNQIAEATIQLWSDTNTGHTSGNYVALKAPTFVGSPPANITFTLPELDGNNGDVLQTDAAGNLSFAAGGIADVVNDTTPQLGGNLDVNGNDITSADVTGVTAGNPITIKAGTSVDGAGGDVTVEGGSASADGLGGDIYLRVGKSSGDNDGDIYVAPASTAVNETPELRFLEAPNNGISYVSLKAPTALGSNPIWTLPEAQQSSGDPLGIDLGEYTIAGLPAAATYPNCWALATDAGGSPAVRTIVRSDGTNWKVVATEGATVA